MHLEKFLIFKGIRPPKVPSQCVLYFQYLQASLYGKILKELRPEPEYFKVGFYGQSLPLFLRVSMISYRTFITG